MWLARGDDLSASRAAVALGRRGTGDRTYIERAVGFDHLAGVP